MNRRIVSFLLAVMLMLSSFPPLTARAEQLSDTEPETVAETVAETVPEEEPEAAEGVTWELVDGVLTISGTGPMEDYKGTDSAPWRDVRHTITDIVIEEGVTTVGRYAFYNCYAATRFSIPSTLTAIGEGAFTQCKGMKKIIIPDNVREIGEDAFRGCWGLESADLGSGLTTIGRNAFYGDGALAAVSIPETVTAIGDGAFLNCSALSYVSLPSNLTTLGASAFCDTAITSVSLPDTLTVIGAGAFSITPLTSVTIPDSVTAIEDSAFKGCKELAEVTLGSGVKTIGERTFSGCGKLTQLELPESLEEFGQYAFSDTGLTEITIPEGIQAVSEYAFGGCKQLRQVSLPESILEIGRDAFSGCTSLQEIALPQNLMYIGRNAFSSTGLKEITIPNSVVQMSYEVFKDSAALERVQLSNHLTEIEHGLFWGCRSLTEVIIPRRITSVVSQSFWGCTSLSSITLPGVKKIEQYAFQNCPGLTSVYLGESLEGVGNTAFYYCQNLTDVYYEGSEAQWNEVKISFSNEPLLNATYHYNVPIPAEDYYTLSLSTDEREFSVKMPKVLELDVSLARNGEPLSDWRFPSISWAGGKELAQPQWEQRGNTWRLTLIPVLIGDDTATMTDPLSGETLQFTLSVTSNRFWSHVDNDTIRINGSGNGYAYFKGEPNQTYWYYKDGVVDFAYSNDSGVLEILLGSFETPGTYKIPLEFYKVNEQPMKNTRVYEAVVTVTPLEFTQQWDFSLEAGMGVAVGGLEVELGDFEAKAALGQFSMEAGSSAALSMTRTWVDGKQDLELTSTHGVKAGAGLECGVTGEYKALDVELANASVGLDATGTITYGIRIRDYSLDNMEQQQAIATFLLGEALQYSNNYLAKTFYEKLTENAYDHESIDVVDGTGAAAAGVFDAGAYSLQVNKVDVFSELSADAEGSVTINQKSYDNGEASYSTSFVTEGNMSALSNAFSQGVLNMDYLGRDITVEVQKNGSVKTLRTTSLSAEQNTVTGPSLGKEYTSDYHSYLFAGSALGELRHHNTRIGEYVDAKRIALGNKDLVSIAEMLSTCEVDIAYSRLQKTQMIQSLPLKFGLELGVGGDVEATLSYVQTVEHTNATGYAVDDQLYLSGRSYGIDEKVKSHVVSLDQVIADAMESLASDIANFFHKVSDSVQNGVRKAQAWIDGKTDSVVQWMVSITSPKGEEDGSWKSSAAVAVGYGGRSLSAAAGVSATVGRPYLIQVTQTETGETVEDLSAEPLTFTVAYTQQELEAAGANADTALALFRYDPAQDLYIYTNCSHDPEAMTVTAQLLTGGQYVLALAEGLPELPPEEETTFQWEGASVSLGNSLALSFFLQSDDSLEGAYAELTRTYADGREDHVVTVPIQKLSTQPDRMYVTYQGIAAKEMGDTVTVVICDKQGNVIGTPCADSIQSYAMRQLEKTDNSKLQTLLVDMLNYGAEAQKHFGYDTEHPANCQLTEQQKRYATGEVETKSILDAGTGRVATALTLKYRISLDFFFSSSALGEDLTGLYALADYTDHYNVHKVVRINGKDFQTGEDGSVYVPVSCLNVADYGKEVTCTVYDADGNVLAWAKDSIEGYAHRMYDRLPDIVEAIVKFGTSSYKYFH